jgi:flavin-dependent dehydrogenase
VTGLDSCDVLVAGGGPAGSSCAWRLRESGLDVLVVDRATFPRDKVCAGWITPQVISELALDVADYRQGRTFQAMTAFLTGAIGDGASLVTSYDRPVSYGIRRCEFDHYLLERSGARLKLGTAIDTLRRAGRYWIVNDAIRTPMIVGAGGHFCPVARRLNEPSGPRAGSIVVAREVEFAVDAGEDARFATAPECPELYFSRDMNGYGWCVRKERHLNVGFGQLDPHALPKATDDFVAFLQAKARIPRGRRWPWRGHAYALSNAPGRRVVDEGVLLVGDAAGLAYSQSGEGIRPAIESGLLAASAIVEGRGRYDREALAPYERRLRQRFPPERSIGRLLPSRMRAPLALRLLKSPTFVRHVVLNRWFLHAHERALAA